MKKKIEIDENLTMFYNGSGIYLIGKYLFNLNIGKYLPSLSRRDVSGG